MAQQLWPRRWSRPSKKIPSLTCSPFTALMIRWRKRSRAWRRGYGAAGVTFSEKARAKLQQFNDWCFAKLPVCIAKTQYSFSDNPKLLGAPTGWTLNITDASLSAGAGFVVAIAGNMMLMPGLPKVSRAASVDVNAKGEILGI